MNKIVQINLGELERALAKTRKTATGKDEINYVETFKYRGKGQVINVI